MNTKNINRTFDESYKMGIIDYTDEKNSHEKKMIMEKMKKIIGESLEENVLTLIENPNNKPMYMSLKARYPITDEIDVSKDLIITLFEKFGSQVDFTKKIPADLIISKMIPLKSLKIAIHDTPVEIRIFEQDDYVPFSEGGDVVGLIRIGEDGVYHEIIVGEEDEGIVMGRMILSDKINSNLDKILRAKDYLSEMYVADMRLFRGGFYVWYLLQMAMLHPVYKDLFVNPSRVPISTKKANKSKNNKHKVKYVKRHIIKPDDFEKAENGAKFERKTMVWYVMGHYRHYKNGTKKFIQPQWRGPLRNAKKNEYIREREIAV